MSVDNATLGKMAQKLRRHSLESTAEAGSGHPDHLHVLRRDHVGALLRRDALRPRDPSGRGHGRVRAFEGPRRARSSGPPSRKRGRSPTICSGCAATTARSRDTPRPRSPWVRVATGSLGQGLSAAAGMAWRAASSTARPAASTSLLGDGEAAEGSVWEAAEFASFNGLDNLCAIIDVNRLGQSGPTMYQHDMAVYEARLRAFGWDAIVVDGHDVAALREAFARGRRGTGKPLGDRGAHLQGQGRLVPRGQGGLARQAAEEGRGAAEGAGRAGGHRA